MEGWNVCIASTKPPPCALLSRQPEHVLVPDYRASELVHSAIAISADIIVPTNEHALFGGVADEAEKAGISCIGHSRRASELIEVNRATVISCLRPLLPARPPRGRVVGDRKTLTEMALNKGHVVAKPLSVTEDGVPQRIRFISANQAALSTEGDRGVCDLTYPVWVEDYLPGKEFSLHFFFRCGVGAHIGTTLDYPFLDIDSRVLTGGMGSVSLPDKNEIVPPSVLGACKKMIDAGLKAMQEAESVILNGFVSAQFRITSRGVIFTELDCKPGDPEILALLHGTNGSLSGMLTGKRPLRRTNTYTVALPMVAPGYPDTASKALRFNVSVLGDQTPIYQGDLHCRGEHAHTGRSRTLCVVRNAMTIEAARASAVAAASRIAEKCGLTFRLDVGDVEHNDPSARVRRSLKRLAEKGGKRIMLRLTPDGNRSLDRIILLRGYKSRTEAINAVLIEASSQRGKKTRGVNKL